MDDELVTEGEQAPAGDLPLSRLLSASGVSNDLAEILAGHQASVRMPSQADIEVQLVSKHKVVAALQIASDNSIHLSLFLLSLGALVGFMTNVVTSTNFQWGGVQIAFFAAVATISVVFAGLTIQSSLRVRDQRKDMFK